MGTPLKKYAGIFLFCGAILAACSEKFDLSSVPSGGQPFAGETTYVEIYPPWSGFNQPHAIFVGKDELFYVADYGNNRVVMLNAAGQVLGTKSIFHPLSISQNSKLDLFVGGEIHPRNRVDTNKVDTVGAILKIYLVRQDTVYNAGTDSLPSIRDTSYFYNHDLGRARINIVWSERSHPNRRFPGITVLPNNQYLAVRGGSDNSSFVDPDARVLLFNKGDTLITPLGDLVTRAGSGITDINQPTNILSFPGKRDFILTQSSEGGVYGAVWMVYFFSADFEGWLPKFDPSKLEDRNVDFVRPGRFLRVEAVAIDKRKGDIFIVDSRLDSVMKFDSRGRFRRESFGDRLATTKEYLSGFSHPTGVTFHEKTIYIVDSGNNVIRLFRLSTDF